MPACPYLRNGHAVGDAEIEPTRSLVHTLNVGDYAHLHSAWGKDANVSVAITHMFKN